MSSANRGECDTTGGLYRPTHLCVAHFELFFCCSLSTLVLVSCCLNKVEIDNVFLSPNIASMNLV